MNRRWIVNLLMLGAVLALALVAYFEPGRETPKAPGKLTDLKPADIQRVHIERKDKPDLVLYREGDRWLIEHAPPLPAERFQVDSLLGLADAEVTRSYAADKLDAAAVGLDPPGAKVRFDDTLLMIGGRDALDGLRYIQVGERIHLVPDIHQYLVEAPFTRYLRRRLFASGETLRALRLPDLTLEQRDGHWTLKENPEVSADRLQQFVDRWREASALDVKPLDDKAQGDRIEIETGSGRVALVLVEREPELVLARPDWGIQYHLGRRADSLLKLPPEPDDTGAPAPQDTPDKDGAAAPGPDGDAD